MFELDRKGGGDLCTLVSLLVSVACGTMPQMARIKRGRPHKTSGSVRGRRESNSVVPIESSRIGNDKRFISHSHDSHFLLLIDSDRSAKQDQMSAALKLFGSGASRVVSSLPEECKACSSGLYCDLLGFALPTIAVPSEVANRSYKERRTGRTFTMPPCSITLWLVVALFWLTVLLSVTTTQLILISPVGTLFDMELIPNKDMDIMK